MTPASTIEMLSKDTTHVYKDEIICPWCGYKRYPDEPVDDGYRDCSECGGWFEIETNYDRTFSTSRDRWGHPRWVCADDLCCDECEQEDDWSKASSSHCFGCSSRGCCELSEEGAGAPSKGLGVYDEPRVYLCDAEPIAETWSEWAWPSWVPKEIVGNISRVHCPTPRSYFRNLETTKLPQFGEVVAMLVAVHGKLQRLAHGRWVWDGLNDLGWIVEENGRWHRGYPYGQRGRSYESDRVYKNFRGSCYSSRHHNHGRVVVTAAQAMKE